MRSRRAASTSRRFRGPSSIRTRSSTRRRSCCARPGTITACRRCSGRGCRRWRIRDARRGIRRRWRAATSTRSICKDLEAAGIAIPEDALARSRRRRVDRSRRCDEEGWDRAVLKPRIAATAYGTFLIERGTSSLGRRSGAGAGLRRAAAGSDSRSRRARRDLAGLFSAARSATRSLKRAKARRFSRATGFRRPCRSHHAVAGRCWRSPIACMTHVPSTCLYARVDVVESSRGPLLMELELIEPELYFLFVPEAADRIGGVDRRPTAVVACAGAADRPAARCSPSLSRQRPTTSARCRCWTTGSLAVDQHAAGESRRGARDASTAWTYDDLEMMRAYVEALAEAAGRAIATAPCVAGTSVGSDLGGDQGTDQGPRAARRLRCLHASAPRSFIPMPRSSASLPIVVDATDRRSCRRRSGARRTERSVIVKSFDGRVESFELRNLHWDFAMDLLDALPAAPRRDPIVAQWYRAIGAYFAQRAPFRRRVQAFRRAPGRSCRMIRSVLFGEACLKRRSGRRASRTTSRSRRCRTAC